MSAEKGDFKREWRRNTEFRAQRVHTYVPLPTTLVIFDTNPKRRPTLISRYVDHGIRVLDHPVPLDRSGTDAIDGMGRVGWWFDRKVGGIWGTIQQQAISSFAGRIVYALYIYTHTYYYTWKAARYASVMYWLGSWGLQVAFWRLRHQGIWISSRFLIKIPHELGWSNRYSRPECVYVSRFSPLLSVCLFVVRFVLFSLSLSLGHPRIAWWVTQRYNVDDRGAGSSNLLPSICPWQDGWRRGLLIFTLRSPWFRRCFSFFFFSRFRGDEFIEIRENYSLYSSFIFYLKSGL